MPPVEPQRPGNEKLAERSERIRHTKENRSSMQSPPMLFTRDGHGLYLGDMYRGASAFLVCSGPSLRTHDLSLLEKRGIVALSVNNAATVVRTQWWCSVDDPGNFSEAIWYDPRILKCVPEAKFKQRFRVRNAVGELVESTEVVGDLPGVMGYRRNESFDPARYLYEDTFNWGNHSRRLDALGYKGCRSVMLVALRLLFVLGVRRVYLVGCDFKMAFGRRNYAFPQDRSPGSVRGNNSSYQILDARFHALLPYFQREGFEVFNCTPDSGLTAFPHVPYEQAIAEASRRVPLKIDTEGMYDRKERERRAAAPHDSEPAPRSPGPASPAPPSRRDVTWPSFTLVLPIDERGAEELLRRWPTWTAAYPELAAAPRIVVHDARLDVRRRLASWRNRSEVDFVALPVKPGRVPRRASDGLNLVLSRVRTPWVLRLNPQLSPAERRSWPATSWFEPDVRGRLPAIVAPPQPLTYAADRMAAWSRWAVRHLPKKPCDAVFAGIDAAPPPSRPAAVIHSPWMWLNTEWARSLSAAPAEEMPDGDDDFFLFVRAALGDAYVVAVPEGDGWETLGDRLLPPPRALRP